MDKNLMHPTTSPTLVQLITFYRDCVTEEQRKSLSVPSNSNGKSFFEPRFIDSKADPSILLGISPDAQCKRTPNANSFLGSAGRDPDSNYLYAYPNFRDHKGNLVPLFFTPVTLLPPQDKPTQLAILRTDTSSILLNLDHFERSHPSANAKQEIASRLESPDFGSFEDRLKLAFQLMGQPFQPIEILATPPGQVGWKNRPIIIDDAGLIYTRNLKRDLDELVKTADTDPQKFDGTALSTFLLDQPLGLLSETDARQTEIQEIVALNRNQRRAVRTALTSNLTTISGPPGTGKSQVAAALITSLSSQRRTCLFASKNNFAVDVIDQRLSELLSPHNWTLRLGNSRKLDETVSDKINDLADYQKRAPEPPGKSNHLLLAAKQSRAETEAAIAETAKLFERLDSECQDRAATLCHLKPFARTQWINGSYRTRIDRIQSVAPWACQSVPGLEQLAKNRPSGIALRFLNRFFRKLYQRYCAGKFRRLHAPDGTTPGICYSPTPTWKSILHNATTIKTLSELIEIDKAINELEMRLAQSTPFAENADRLRDLAAEITKQSIHLASVYNYGQIAHRTNELTAKLNSYQNSTTAPKLARETATQDLLKITPSLIVTNLSARTSLPLTPALFDTVILDEASQCDIASALPLLYRAKNAVVIGDRKQLKHISRLRPNDENRIAKRAGIPHLIQHLSYIHTSLFDRAFQRTSATSPQPIQLLEHYRSQPDIIDLSNQLFYNHELVIRTPASTTASVHAHDIPSSIPADTNGSLANPTEARKVASLLSHLANDPNHQTSSFAVIAPFRKQAEEISRIAQRNFNLDTSDFNISIDTVYSMQGGEADIVIFSPTVTKGAPKHQRHWVSEEEGILNVAITRARRELHIVTDLDYLGSGTDTLARLAKLIRSPNTDNLPQRSPEEEVVLQILRGAGHTFTYQKNVDIAGKHYRLDFTVTGLSGTRYNIEVDGSQHSHNSATIDADLVRDRILRSAGYVVVRIPATSIRQQQPKVEQMLKNLA